MRVNEPITDEEVELREGQVLVSRTDADSRILFANNAFVSVSGFSAEELVGTPHNLVRHPHMPPAAFADLWRTIKSGRPWDGLVKNRTKTGGFYWVRANVTPVIQDGHHTGYISIRTRPQRDEVAAAERAYADIAAGRGRLTIAEGELRRAGWAARLAAFARSVTGRVAISFVVLMALLVAMGAVSIGGMADSNAALRSLHADRLVPERQLALIGDLMHSNVALLREAAAELEAGATEAARERVRQIPLNRDRIGQVWQDYLGTYLTAEEARLADAYAARRARFVAEGVMAGAALAEAGDRAGLVRHLRGTVAPLFAEARQAAMALLDLQERVSAEMNAEAERDYSLHLALSVGMFALASAAALGLALWLMASIRRPLRAMEGHFDSVARGDLQAPIPLPPAREFHHVLRQLRGMRARLAYAAEERREQERQIAAERRAAVQAMAETVERQTLEAVHTVAERTAGMAEEARDMSESAARVSGNATSVAAAAEEALANAQAVSAASEQLTASINEIAAQVAQAGRVAQRAVDGGELAQQRIRSLSDSAARIGDVVQLIGSIAAQTNLLALNATIEAARAGEAGRGFAVVASEVKSLATQTARSTDEISRQIAEIQATTGAVVEAVGDIGQRIGEMAQVSVAVAAAVEQQASATQEIARNVTQTGSAAQEVSQRIAEVSADAHHTGEQAGSLRGGTDAIADTIATLNGRIVHAIRTATEDADRRLQQRHTIGRPCVVELDGLGRIEGVLRDISRSGARVEGVRPVAAGTAGTLYADCLGNGCRAGLSVSACEAGVLRAMFTDGTVSPALAAALDTMESRGKAA